MKKLNLKRLMTVLSLVIFAGFAGCNTEDVDYPIAELDVTPNMLDFEIDGSATETASFEINTNRKWKIEFEDKSVEWIRVSKMAGEGSEKITLTLLPNQAETRSTRLKITASINSTYVTIKQIGSITSTVLYNVTFGSGAPSSSPYAYLDEWTESFGESGEGRATVTFDGSTGVSLRQSGKLSSGYPGASGENKLFFGASSNFTVNTITTTGYSNFKITFGVAHYNNGDNNFTTDKMDLLVSTDGENYTPVGYDISGDHDTTNPPIWWYCTTYVQDLATDKLYVKFVANEGSTMSLDDVTVTGLSSAVPSGPKVTTLPATNVTDTGATLGGSYTANSTPTQLGIEYKAGDGPFTRETYTGEIKSPFTITMTGLTTGANYTYRAYAIIDGNTVTGENVTFRPGGGGPGPVGDEIYIENCGTAVEKVDGYWPYVDAFTGWSRGGSLSQTGVTYTGSSASVRNSGNAYEPSGSAASGAPYVFLGTGTPYFVINDINITGYDNFTFSLTAALEESYTSGTVTWGTVTTSSFKLQASVDGSAWTDLTYTVSSGTGWVTATTGFKTSGANKLYVRISEPSVASKYRFDDFKLVSGGGDGGPTIGDGGGPGPVVGDEIYVENCGTAVEKVSGYWPYVDAFTGWSRGGSLSQSGVTYAGSSASVRNSGNAYEPAGGAASGAPYVFFGTGTPYFTINNINITGYDNFTFSLTAALEDTYTSGTVTWSTVTTSSFKLQASVDGSAWTDLTYTVSSGTGWVTATTGFKTSGANTLYIKISEPSVVSKYRLDDFKLVSGGGDSGPTVGDGTDPGPGPGPDPGEGGVFFSETCGNGEYKDNTTRLKINAFTDWDMKSPVVYSDTYGIADVRSTSSINPHIWFPAPTTNTPDNTSVVKIDGITSKSNVTLSYDVAANKASVDANVIKVRCNGTTMLSIPSTPLSATVNTYATITIAIPDGTTTLEFMSDTNNTAGYRIDNIKLSTPTTR